MEKKRVLLGMSGGIDSTMAALLLMEQGYEVIGVTLRLWSEADAHEHAPEPSYITDAAGLARKLGIIHRVADVRTEFYQKVIRYFKDEYLRGRTPNPCAYCNVVLKWEVLNRFALQLNCPFIATGHYVKKLVEQGRTYITQGVDADKDQSFFLWGLSNEMVQKALFPLGGFTKSEIKEMAEQRGFIALKEKKESTGVCFVPNGNYQPFLARLMAKKGIQPTKGWFVDQKNSFIGYHQGYPFYTVGQRRGLGLSPNEPWYVTRLDALNNQVELGKKSDLYQSQMRVENYHFFYPEDATEEVITRIRYRKQSAISKIQILDDKNLIIYFNQHVWSIAPGQTAVFYKGNVLVGGGYIK